MSALCCAAPGLAGAPNGNGSASQSVYYPFARSSYSYIELNPYAAAAAAAAAAMETASRQTSLHYQQPPFAVQHHQQPQQQQLQQQQQQQQQQIRRRKRLEHAVTETIPSASSGKVSQRIAQLQQSLTSQSVQQQRAHPLLPASSAPRPLSLDAGKDYSQPLTVDCSIEYDLPRVARPPPGAEPLLLIAPRREVVVRPSPQQQQQQQQHWSGPLSQPFVPCAYMTDGAPVSSCSSDSGRGTDTERTSSPAFNQFNGSWMQPPASWMGAGQRVKVNYHKSALPVHPRPAGQSSRFVPISLSGPRPNEFLEGDVRPGPNPFTSVPRVGGAGRNVESRALVTRRHRHVTRCGRASVTRAIV